MRRFLTIALPVGLAVWFSAAAVGAGLNSPDQSASYISSDIDLQPTTSFGCHWIYWRGMWYCI